MFTKRIRSIERLSKKVLLAPLALALLMPTTGSVFAAVLEEIVVTAQRREESLQSVPLAVTAITGDELDRMGVTDIKGITERTPGFTMGSFNAGQPQLYIRGIGSNSDSPAADQSVIVFIDEVYIGRSAGMDIDLFDLERVEVLRGPQGTLFGKNVVGGAVSMITTKPDEDLDLRLEATAGNYDSLDYRGLASGPITATLFGKFSFSSRQRDGYMKSQAAGFPDAFSAINASGLSNIEQSDLNTDSFRGALRFVPNEQMEFNLTANVSRMDQNGPGRHYIGGRWEAAEAFYIPNYSNRIHKNLAVDSGHSITDIFGTTFRAEYFAEDFTVTSLSSYREVEADINNLVFGTDELAALLVQSVPSPFGAILLAGTNPYVEDSETWTQEFRITSAGDGRLQWVAGLYYMHEETRRNERGVIGVVTANGVGGVITLVPVTDGGADTTNETDSYAVFGQLSYAITEDLGITVGARQTWEEKEVDTIATASALNPAGGYTVSLGDDYDALTPTISVDWQVTDDIFTYLSYAEGFKSGGFPGGGGNEFIGSTGFDPEEAINYELGIKTEWLDSRIRLNAALFYTDYTDLQILQLLVPVGADPADPGSLITQNAADAEIEGLEVEFTFLPVDGLTIAGSFTYLKSEFSGFFIPAGFTSPGGSAPADRTGNSLRNAPKYAFNILARYDFTLNNGAAVAVQADFRHKDEVVQDPDELEFAKIPEYDVLDLRASYTTPNENWTVTGWVKNATDEDYLLHNFPVQASGFATPAMPRSYGITVGWRN
jgi:iron complex outermembrane recepter protein